MKLMFLMIMMINIKSRGKDKLSELLEDSKVEPECPTFINQVGQNTKYLCNTDVTEIIKLDDYQILIYSCTFNNIYEKQFSLIYLNFYNELSKFNVIDNCKFQNCQTYSGMIYINAEKSYENCTITNCLFENNTVQSTGNYEINLDGIYGIIQSCKFINTTGYGYICISNDNNLDTEEKTIIQNNFFSIEPNSKSYYMIEIHTTNQVLIFKNKFDITSSPPDAFNVVYCYHLTENLKINSNCVFPYDENKVFMKGLPPSTVVINKTEAFQLECYQESAASDPFSYSDKFSKSNEFSNSNFFSGSDNFSQSDQFPKTDHFSESSKFSSSLHFVPTGVFSKSRQFSESGKFHQTDSFSKSIDFSNTNDFTYSSLFSNSIYFSSSVAFTQSNDFTETYQSSEDSIETSSFSEPSLDEEHLSSSSDEEESSSEDGQSSSFNEDISSSEENQPSPSDGEGNSSEEDQSSPSDGEVSSLEEKQSPSDGEESSSDEQSSPSDGEVSSLEEKQSPSDEEESSSDEQSSSQKDGPSSTGESPSLSQNDETSSTKEGQTSSQNGGISYTVEDLKLKIILQYINLYFDI